MILKELNVIDLYKDVEVKFLSEKQAVMTVFKDGREQEKVTSSE